MTAAIIIVLCAILAALVVRIVGRFVSRVLNYADAQLDLADHRLQHDPYPHSIAEGGNEGGNVIHLESIN